MNKGGTLRSFKMGLTTFNRWRREAEAKKKATEPKVEPKDESVKADEINVKKVTEAKVEKPATVKKTARQ